MQEQWVLRNKKIDDSLPDKFGISKDVLKILANRNIASEEEIKEFLKADMKVVTDGSELHDMDKAVNIMQKVIEENKSIRIMGDYDVDGVTSTYILYQGLKMMGGKVSYFIPHRVKDGYGLHKDIIEQAYKDGVEAIVTCDNGISALEEIDLAKRLGMTVVVTDHHEPPLLSDEEKQHVQQLQKADAVVDPKCVENEGIFKDICGAVVAWKFVWCLSKKMGKEKTFKRSDLSEMAALGTVCDMMPLIKENRSLVKFGLERMKHTNNIGMQALLKELGKADVELNSFDFGFSIGPCINSMGRLDSAIKALELLLEEDEEKAKKRAKEMNQMNQTRKALTEEGVEQAHCIIKNENIEKDKILVLKLENAHESIAGIVAGKLKEEYNRPTIVFVTTDNDILKGSGRSIEAYNMFEELSKCKDMLLTFGGHQQAAGLSINSSDLTALRKHLNDNCRLTAADFSKKVAIDIVKNVSTLDEGYLRSLDILEPCGTGNEKPLFAQKHVCIKEMKIIGKNKDVLKMDFGCPNGAEGITFTNATAKAQYLAINDKCKDFDMAYRPSENEWRGKVTIQAIIENIR